jgi:hypothetical protein
VFALEPRVGAESVLIIDDVGMRKLPPNAAEDMLEIIMRRYERASTILTFDSGCRGLGATPRRQRRGRRHARPPSPPSYLDDPCPVPDCRSAGMAGPPRDSAR